MVREPAVNPAIGAGDAVLETRGLSRRFGGIAATDEVSLRVVRGARHALIGPNGAGKTTLVNLLTGVLTPSAGTILLEGRDITRLAAHRRVERGLVRTFQINQLFGGLTPVQSLALAVSGRLGRSAGWWRPLGGGNDRRVAERCDRLLAEFHLDDVMNQKVALLPYGKRRLLEIALAIACMPRVLLLDEPVAGVPEGERQQILETIGSLPAEVTVLLIEHDMDLVFNFARTVTVLVNGTIFAEGDAQSISADRRVRAVYLGEAHEPRPGPAPSAAQVARERGRDD
jgi:branched-chain amino acid transport system ATP-binding protein